MNKKITLQKAASNVQAHLKKIQEPEERDKFVKSGGTIVKRWMVSKGRKKGEMLMVTQDDIRESINHKEEVEVYEANKGLIFCIRCGVIPDFGCIAHVSDDKGMHKIGDYTIKPFGNSNSIDQVAIRVKKSLKVKSFITSLG